MTTLLHSLIFVAAVTLLAAPILYTVTRSS